MKKKENFMVLILAKWRPYSILGTFTISIQLHHIYTVIQEKQTSLQALRTNLFTDN